MALSKESIDLIQGWLAFGYQVEMGPHSNGVGYHCLFYKDEQEAKYHCDDCAGHEFDWKQAGHGHTLDEAVRIAHKLALGKPTKNYKSNAFDATK